MAVVQILWPITFLRMLAARSMATCEVCRTYYRWGHFVEEYANSDPFLTLTETGILWEDGDWPILVPYSNVVGVLVRQKYQFWETGGGRSYPWHPPFRLEITFRVPDGDQSYSRWRASSLDLSIESEEERARRQLRRLNIWPAKVQGGLFSLVRFGKALQQELVTREIEPSMEGFL